MFVPNFQAESFTQPNFRAKNLMVSYKVYVNACVGLNKCLDAAAVAVTI